MASSETNHNFRSFQSRLIISIYYYKLIVTSLCNNRDFIFSQILKFILIKVYRSWGISQFDKYFLQLYKRSEKSLENHEDTLSRRLIKASSTFFLLICKNPIKILIPGPHVYLRTRTKDNKIDPAGFYERILIILQHLCRAEIVKCRGRFIFQNIFRSNRFRKLK